MTGFAGTMFESGATPALEQAMQFHELRHRLVLSNVANSDTPGYRRIDLDEARFQRALGDAIAARDRGADGAFATARGAIVPAAGRGGFRPGSTIPLPGNEGPLRHDENDVSLEREMALLARNAGRYTAYSALLAKTFQQIGAAIAGRPLE